MAEKVKLTKARREVLEDAAVAYPKSITMSAGYGPGRWCVEQGFLEEHEGRYGGSSYTLTDAGRAALE